MGQTLEDGNSSDPFQVTNGVKQGCVLTSSLFSLMFSAMQAVTKVKETVIKDLLFTDDFALNANKKQEMQLEMSRFSSVRNNFGLTIST